MMAEAAPTTSTAARRSSTSTWAARPRRSATSRAGSALMQDEPLVARDRRGGGRLRAARRAGDAEDAHRLVRERAQRGARRARSPRTPASRMLTVHGRTREQGYRGEAEYETIAAVKRAVAHSGRRQRRHRLAGEGARGAALHRRRRDHDRPRRAGPAVDLPRDRALPRAPASTLRAAARRRGRALLLEHLDDHYASTASTPACAARASTSAGRCAPARRRGVPRRDEHDRRLRRAGAGGRPLLRSPADDRCARLRAAYCTTRTWRRLPLNSRHDRARKPTSATETLEECVAQPGAATSGPARRRAARDVRDDPDASSRGRCSRS